LLNLKHNNSLILLGCAEDDSYFIGMGGRAFYPGERDGRLLQTVDTQLKDSMAFHPISQ
jgi:hypothetical protein